MTDAIRTNVAEVLPPPAEAPDRRIARERILDHVAHSEGEQTTAQIRACTGLSRAVVDPLLSRLTKQGALERVTSATYRLVRRKPAPEALPLPEQRVCAGHAIEEWMAR
jgi:predicted transcriptional regulator of viral defense system